MLPILNILFVALGRTLVFVFLNILQVYFVPWQVFILALICLIIFFFLPNWADCLLTLLPKVECILLMISSGSTYKNFFFLFVIEREIQHGLRWANGRVGMLLDYSLTGQEFKPQHERLGSFELSGSKSVTDWHPVWGMVLYHLVCFTPPKPG